MVNSEQVISRFYEEIWNQRNIAVVDEICTSDLVFKGSLGDETVGLHPFIAYVESIHEALSEYHCEIEDLVSNANRCFVKMRFSGRHTGELLGFAPTGQMLSWPGAALFHLVHGKIHRLWVLGDVHGLQTQLSNNA